MQVLNAKYLFALDSILLIFLNAEMHTFALSPEHSPPEISNKITLLKESKIK